MSNSEPGSDRSPLSSWLWHRITALLALSLPCLAGLAYLYAFEAPRSYLIVNAGALTVGLGWIAFGRLPSTLRVQRILSAFLLALMALPLILGPDINGVARWLFLRGFSLHTGMLAIPLLAVFAARDREYAPAMLLTAIFLTLIQPDAASAFALMLASVGLYFAWHEWKPGVVAIVGFAVGILASLRGELPPQQFVERILGELIPVAPLVALGLALSLIVSFLLILKATPLPKAERFAVAGTFAGFAITALMSNYPNILIGYGAAPILGFALALSARAKSE